MIPTNIRYNNLQFRIKYRTQDNLRVNQVRPDLVRFMKNSSYEKYPHHEQYFGQQDKIIDSERFSANLFGKLIRVGNNVYQCNEYASSPEQEKEAGDLVMIDREPYYVTAVDNEYYPDAIFQKVTYSKNFNQLSQIITIPSEPRFYEVSERSKIRREVRILEFFELSTVDATTATNPKFIPSNNWRTFITNLMFRQQRTMPNFAYSVFMADHRRSHKGSFGQYVDPNLLFPNSEIDRTDPNNIRPLAPSDRSECIVPLLHFPLHDGIVFEWDMEDNFKVGDFIDTNISGNQGSPTANNAYFAQQPLRYVDVLGRADLFRFTLFNRTNWTDMAQIRALPKAEPSMRPTAIESIVGIQGSATTAIALDKDNREMLGFNYQISLLHKNQEGDADFITFPNLFGNKDNDLQVCLLNRPQSQFNENVSMTPSTVLADNVPISFGQSSTGSIQINFGTPVFGSDALGNRYDISMVQCIVLYHINTDFGRTAYICKNVNQLADQYKLQSWYIYPVFNTN